jgi:hypothetical protein
MSQLAAVLGSSGSPAPKTYVDDVFSAYTYTGNGSTQTITNGIDLAGKGGLVWLKSRTNASGNHFLFNSVNGPSKVLWSNLTNAGTDWSGYLSQVSNGFSVSHDATSFSPNVASQAYASWTFRKAAKFFDVVTYTADGGSNKSIAHSLGVPPGIIITKDIDAGGTNWAVWHRSLPGIDYRLQLNTTSAQLGPGSQDFGTTLSTSTAFFVGGGGNVSGRNYVAYLFAHDTSADGLIQCGSFTTDGSGKATVSLGWEPQYVLYKATNNTGNWLILDSSRQLTADGKDEILYTNTSGAALPDSSGQPAIKSDGFTITTTAGISYIYMAIRRSNKPPTSGTQVFSSVVYTGNNATTPPAALSVLTDVYFSGFRGGTGRMFADRLRGSGALRSDSTNLEDTSLTYVKFDSMLGVTFGNPSAYTNSNATNYLNYGFKRAPGFMDVVCYTGTGTAHTESHNLGVTPELMIFKERSGSGDWAVYHKNVGAGNWLRLSLASVSAANTTYLNNTVPTSTVFTVGAANDPTNQTSQTYVAYLFASLAGISKVSTYTGNGTSQTINCGFSAGARFVLIKRTDSTGDWYVWDTTRGIVAGNDPYMTINSTAAEVTSDDPIDPDSSGFIVNQTAANINVNAATYIYLAIA